MANITKCDGNNCSKKEQCYRFTAIENKFRQAYSSPTPESKDCEYFINNKFEKK